MKVIEAWLSAYQARSLNGTLPSGSAAFTVHLSSSECQMLGTEGLADFDEIAGGGYAPLTVDGDFSIGTVEGNVSRATLPDQAFAFTGGLSVGDTVRSLFILDAGGALAFVLGFLPPYPVVQNGLEIKVANLHVDLRPTDVVAGGGGDGGAASDTTPDTFVFPTQVGVPLSTLVTSAPITVTGIDAPAMVTVSGGKYSINGGDFTSTPGTVVSGDQVRAQHTSSGANEATITTTVTIGGVAGTFSSVTPSAGGGYAFDWTPDSFSFTGLTNQLPSVVVESSTITVSGITTPTLASRGSASGVSHEFRVNGGAWRTSPCNVQNGDTIQMRGQTSQYYGQSVYFDLVVGGVTGRWTVANMAQDTIPTSFGFAPKVDQELDTLVESDPIYVYGFTGTLSVSISGNARSMQFRINGGSWRSTTTNVAPNSTIQLRAKTALTLNTETYVVLHVGSMSATFKLKTKAS